MPDKLLSLTAHLLKSQRSSGVRHTWEERQKKLTEEHPAKKNTMPATPQLPHQQHAELCYVSLAAHVRHLERATSTASQRSRAACQHWGLPMDCLQVH